MLKTLSIDNHFNILEILISVLNIEVKCRGCIIH